MDPLTIVLLVIVWACLVLYNVRLWQDRRASRRRLDDLKMAQWDEQNVALREAYERRTGEADTL